MGSTFLRLGIVKQHQTQLSEVTIFCRRYERVSSDRAVKSSEHIDTIKQLTLQNESLTNTFKVSSSRFHLYHVRITRTCSTNP